MRYGPTLENMALIFEKAKAKENGVYRLRGVSYRVRNSRVTHIAHNGKVLELYGHFNVVVGDCGKSQEAAAKALRAI